VSDNGALHLDEDTIICLFSITLEGNTRYTEAVHADDIFTILSHGKLFSAALGFKILYTTLNA